MCKTAAGAGQIPELAACLRKAFQKCRVTREKTVKFRYRAVSGLYAKKNGLVRVRFSVNI